MRSQMDPESRTAVGDSVRPTGFAPRGNAEETQETVGDRTERCEVSLSCLSWNQLEGWLRAVDGLRQAA
jgi:hypothetical protein